MREMHSDVAQPSTVYYNYEKEKPLSITNKKF